MHEVKETIFIDRTPEDVHRFTMDADNALLWQSNLVEYELSDEKLGKGTISRGVTKVAGRKIEFEMEVAEHEFGQHDLWRTIKAPMDLTLEFTYEPTGDGTTMTYHLMVDSLGGLFGKLADPLVTRMYQRDTLSNLAKLKDLLEA
jgi:hypothetical protein